MNYVYKILFFLLLSFMIIFTIDLIYFYVTLGEMSQNSILGIFVFFIEIFLLTLTRKYFMRINLFFYILLITIIEIVVKQYLMTELLHYNTGNASSFFDLLKMFIENPSFINGEYLSLYFLYIMLIISIFYFLSHFILKYCREQLF